VAEDRRTERVAGVRVILAGSRSFGAAVLDRLVGDGHEVVAVWSPGEIGQDSRRDALTAAAWRKQLWTPHTERTPKSVQALEADLFVAAHSHDFIGRDSRAATRLGGLGYHPSLLPRHRGRDAVRWTIHLGDPIAGGTVYWLTDQVDGGPICEQEWCWVRPGDDASRLWRRDLFPMGVNLLASALRRLDAGLVREVPQDEAVATWEPSWERPPLYRPELPQIGNGVAGFTYVTR
jgi:methionyl-tRNA formyltransferase